ncbi:MAG: hypothetical protein XU12_C0021G0034 [Deltaproteobacteria bacterium CSP1-8]|nr:MAG: hypothetical protein XU12_C0021G0034 [Deltaproteobacteria bacterium CSP1-8]
MSPFGMSPFDPASGRSTKSGGRDKRIGFAELLGLQAYITAARNIPNPARMMAAIEITLA